MRHFNFKLWNNLQFKFSCAVKLQNTLTFYCKCVFTIMAPNGPPQKYLHNPPPPMSAYIGQMFTLIFELMLKLSYYSSTVGIFFLLTMKIKKHFWNGSHAIPLQRGFGFHQNYHTIELYTTPINCRFPIFLFFYQKSNIHLYKRSSVP